MRKPCTTCKHDHGRCAGKSRKGGHQYCWEPKTNGDRIRKMTDEELAEWLVIQTVYQESAFSPPAYRNFLTDLDDTKENAIKDTKEWIKQPPKEEV